jgi:hypothetical protein
MGTGKPGITYTVNILLWVLQVLAALMFGASGVMKVFMTVSSSNGIDFPSSSACEPSATSALGCVMSGLFVNDKRISECGTKIDWLIDRKGPWMFMRDRLYRLGLPGR